MKSAHKSDPSGANHKRSEAVIINRSLHNLYLRQVLSNLLRIERALAELKPSPNSQKCLLKIKEASRAIADLAMIHGFEGMETISRKLSSTIEYLLRSSMDLSFQVVYKVQVAIRTMRKVAEMEAFIERQMTVERIDRHVELNQEKVQDCAEKVTHSLNFLLNKQLEFPLETEAETNSQLLFDIREATSLMDLVDGTSRKDVTESSLELFDSENY